MSHTSSSHTPTSTTRAASAAARALAPQALAVCHPLDRPLVDSVDRLIDDRYRELRHAHEIDPDPEFCDWVRANDDGGTVADVIVPPAHIDLGDRRLAVLHTPGHTQGHLTVVDELTGTAIVADAVMAGAVPDAAGEPAFAPTYRYPADYRESCAVLRRLDPERLLCSHYAVVEGRAAAAAFIDESESFAARLEQEILDVSRDCSPAAARRRDHQGRRSKGSHLGREHGLDACPTGGRAPRGPRAARPRSDAAGPSRHLRRGRAQLSRARASEELLDGVNRAVVLADDRIRVTLLPDRGADIHAVEDLRTGVDVLWKTPWGLRRRGVGSPAKGSAEAWLDTYAGGWQVLLPSGGGPSSHRGVHHSYHGEACSLPWAATIATDADGGDQVELRVRLADSPLLVERVVSLVPGRGEVVVSERVTNESDRPLEYMWVHHPAFGAPLVAPGTRIRTSASTILADASHDGPGNPLEPGTGHGWPIVRARDGAHAGSVGHPGRIVRPLAARVSGRLRRGDGNDRERCPRSRLHALVGPRRVSVRLAVAGAGRHRRSSVARARVYDRDRAGDELPGHRARRRRRDARRRTAPSPPEPP